MGEPIPQPTTPENLDTLPGVAFDDLRFTDIAWEDTPEATVPDPHRVVTAAKMRIDFDGQTPLVLRAKRDVKHRGVINRHDVDFTLASRDKKVVARGLIYADLEGRTAEVSVDRDAADVEHKGIGMKLYQRGLDYVAELAKSSGKAITHIDSFQRQHTAGQQGYTEEQWDALFGAYLIGQGYSQEGKEYKKTYQPK